MKENMVRIQKRGSWDNIPRDFRSCRNRDINEDAAIGSEKNKKHGQIYSICGKCSVATWLDLSPGSELETAVQRIGSHTQDDAIIPGDKGDEGADDCAIRYCMTKNKERLLQALHYNTNCLINEICMILVDELEYQERVAYLLTTALDLRKAK